MLPNAELVNLEREERVTVDVLGTYMPHPGTALYIGYDDRYENLLPAFSGSASRRRATPRGARYS